MDKSIMQKSIIFGGFLGLIFGGILGGGLGSITGNVNGILVGLAVGVGLGILTGTLTGALTTKTAGTTGGVSIGAYTGMGFGAALGIVVGILIPTSLRMSANTQGLPVLDALTLSRFETVVFFCFFLSVLGTGIGAWISGHNLAQKKQKADRKCKPTCS